MHNFNATNYIIYKCILETIWNNTIIGFSEVIFSSWFFCRTQIYIHWKTQHWLTRVLDDTHKHQVLWDMISRTLVRNLYDFHRTEILAAIINEYTDWENPKVNSHKSFQSVIATDLIFSFGTQSYCKKRW